MRCQSSKHSKALLEHGKHRSWAALPSEDAWPQQAMACLVAGWAWGDAAWKWTSLCWPAEAKERRPACDVRCIWAGRHRLEAAQPQRKEELELDRLAALPVLQVKSLLSQWHGHADGACGGGYCSHLIMTSDGSQPM